MRQDVERKRQVLNGVEDPSEKELREQYEREDLVRGALAREVRNDNHGQRAAEQRDDDQRECHPRELIRAEMDLQDEAEDDDPKRLRQRHKRFAEDLPEDDRVTRDRRDEDLLAEILLTIGEKRD